MASGEGLSVLVVEESLEQAVNKAQAITIVGTGRLRVRLTITRRPLLILEVVRWGQATSRALDGMCNPPSPVGQQRPRAYC